MAQTPEGKIKKQITDLVDDLQKEGLKIYWERRDASGLNYRKGKADLFVVLAGLHIEVETKAPKGEQSAMQETWQRQCLALDIPYILAESKEEFLTKLEKFISS